MPEVPSHFSEFDSEAAGEALGSQPRTMRDVAHGDGEVLTVGDTTLEVYRDAGVARVTTPDARIELFRVPSYTVTGERVVFEQGENDDRSRLLVRGDGKVSFYPVLRATETSQTQETASSGRQDPPAGHVPSESSSGASSPEDREAVQAIELRGRLGRDPWFGTRDERPAAGFPLAVNPEDGGKTVWHNVVTFDDTAGQLQEAVEKRQIAKGKLVDVTGQPVVVEDPGANGRARRRAEFHASTVARVQSTVVRPSR